MCDQCGCEDQLTRDEKMFGEAEDYKPCPKHPDELVPWMIDCGKCMQEDEAEEAALDYMGSEFTS